MQLLNDEIIICSNCSHFDKDNRFCNKWFGITEPQDFCTKGALEIESDNNNRGHEKSSEQTFPEEPPF